MASSIVITGILSDFAICMSNNAEFPHEYLLASLDDANFKRLDAGSDEKLQQFNFKCLFWPSDMRFMETISTFRIEQMAIEDLGQICNSIFKGRKVLIEADEKYHKSNKYYHIMSIKLTE